MNSYATLYDVLVALGIDPNPTAGVGDNASAEREARDRALVLSMTVSVSRQVERKFAHRHFWTVREVRYFSTGPDPERLKLTDSDLLSVVSLTTDSEVDGTWDGETWVEDTDYWLWPYGEKKWPKTEIRPLSTRGGNFTLPKSRDRYVQIDGVFGYGDGLSSDPWLPVLSDTGAAITVTFSNPTTKTATVSAADHVRAGHTLLVDDEQVFVESDSDTTLICRRAVNSTTGAAHSTVSFKLAQYPEELSLLVQQLAVGAWNRRAMMGFDTEDFDGHRVTFNRSQRFLMKCLCEHLVKPIVV